MIETVVKAGITMMAAAFVLMLVAICYVAITYGNELAATVAIIMAVGATIVAGTMIVLMWGAR